MQEQDMLTPILSEQSLLMMGGAIVGLVVFAGICFTIVLYRDPDSIRSFRGGNVVHYVTVIAVVMATITLALERVLTGEAAASILSGIIGYVLGTLRYRVSVDRQGDEKVIDVR